eukprot:ANDGO_06845.mRNA.1 hypothetical protein
MMPALASDFSVVAISSTPGSVRNNENVTPVSISAGQLIIDALSHSLGITEYSSTDGIFLCKHSCSESILRSLNEASALLCRHFEIISEGNRMSLESCKLQGLAIDAVQIPSLFVPAAADGWLYVYTNVDPRKKEAKKALERSQIEDALQRLAPFLVEAHPCFSPNLPSLPPVLQFLLTIRDGLQLTAASGNAAYMARLFSCDKMLELTQYMRDSGQFILFGDGDDEPLVFPEIIQQDCVAIGGDYDSPVFLLNTRKGDIGEGSVLWWDLSCCEVYYVAPNLGSFLQSAVPHLERLASKEDSKCFILYYLMRDC